MLRDIFLPLLSKLRKFPTRGRRTRLHEHIHVTTLREYAEGLASVVQTAFSWQLLDKTCKKLARRANEPDAIWFEASCYAHGLLRLVMGASDDLHRKACIMAASIFARRGVGDKLSGLQLDEYLVQFEARICQYEAAFNGPDPAWQAPRLLASSIGVADPFHTHEFGSIQLPLAMLFKDALAHIHFTPEAQEPGA